MKLQHPWTRWRTTVIALVMVMSVCSCSGITPDGNLRNNREEGPEKGLFTGPGGEFVIGGPASSDTEEKAEAAGTEPDKIQD